MIQQTQQQLGNLPPDEAQDFKADSPQRTTPRSLVRADLAAIAERFEDAGRRIKRATTISDREAAEAERRDAVGDFWAAEDDLADLLLLLIRCCEQHRPDVLRLYLAEVLRTELEPIVDALAKVEARK
jgi:hypothetical protein